MFTLNLPVDYHQQDKGTAQDGIFYCGPACALMVLHSIGKRLLSQDRLYDDCHSNSKLDTTVPWFTAPDGLKWTMNHRKPASFRKRFKIITRTNRDAMAKKIAWTIYHDKVAPIALVHGLGHWIVVRGFDSNKAPSRAFDNLLKIEAFWINDPAPAASDRTPPSSPPPHKQGDKCGSGDRGYGEANEHIVYRIWKSRYTNKSVPRGYWQGKFVAVCDPDPGSEGEVHAEKNQKSERKERKNKIENNENEQNMYIKKIVKRITEKQAQEHAHKAIKKYKLIDQPYLKEILKDVLADKPKLVKDLEGKNEFYYIVPLVGKDKTVRSLVNVDCKDGKYRQASFAKDLESPIVFSFLSEKKVIELVRKQLNIKKERIIVNKKYLVWMPCIESFSPNFPFHEVAIGNFKVYVRIDGKVFTALTTDVPGA